VRSRLRPLVTILLLALAVTGLVVGFASAKTGDTAAPIVYNSYVRQLIPSPSAIERRQTQVGVRLVEGFQGRLIIDGKEIPDDQVYASLDPNTGAGGNTGVLSDNTLRNDVLFTPGPNKEFEIFSPGEHCAVAIFWRSVDGPDVNPQRQEWCFKLA
jgi:hypothetical protein